MTRSRPVPTSPRASEPTRRSIPIYLFRIAKRTAIFFHSRLGADLSSHSRPFQLRPATTRRAFTTRATATESGSKSDEIVGMPVVLIDNRSDPLATVVSVQFSDVLGQLLDTVESLKALGLNVSRAEVTQDENPNKFYVTDAATSEKVVKSEQIENIRMAVINNMIAYHPESKQYFEGASASFGSFDVDANPLGARPPSKVKTKVKGNLQKAVAGVRPEDCSVTDPKKGSIEGQIYTTELIGDHTLVTVKWGSDQIVVKAHKDFDGKQGDAVGVILPPENLYIFDETNGERIR